MLVRGLLLLLSLSMAPLSSAKPKASLMPQGGSDESIMIMRLSDNKVIYESGSVNLMIPASVTKIITSAALLHYFSPAHTFKTKFYTDGKRQGDTFRGSLYVKGDGDPLLVNEKLWQLAADLKHMGIKNFSGDLVIDNSLFDNEKRDSSRQDGLESSANAYDAPVSAFGVNFNTLPIAIAPGLQAGSPGLVTFDPYALPAIEIKNQTSTEKGHRSSVQAVRKGQGARSSITVTGRIGQQSPIVKLYRAMGDPVREGGDMLRSFLFDAGISLKGRVTEGLVPSDATLLYTLESYDLGYIVRGLNHYSNNFIADMLVKRLGAAFPAPGNGTSLQGGTLRSGVQAIERFLREEVGIRDRFEIYNGSGLDHRNRFSAAQLVKVLSYMQNRMDLYPEFLASFPAAGWSGTLEKRFKSQKQSLLHGVVRAKTGTLSQPVSVSSLAGYMGHPKYGPVAFAFLNNGENSARQPTVAEFRQRQDQALLKILEEF